MKRCWVAKDNQLIIEKDFGYSGRASKKEYKTPLNLYTYVAIYREGPLSTIESNV